MMRYQDPTDLGVLDLTTLRVWREERLPEHARRTEADLWSCVVSRAKVVGKRRTRRIVRAEEAA